MEFPSAASKKTVAALERLLGGEAVAAAGCSPDGKTVAVATATRIAFAVEKSEPTDWEIARLHSVSVLPFDEKLALVAPLVAGELFSGFALRPPDASLIAEAVRARLREREEGAAWWDDPRGSLGIRISPIGLLARPADSAIPETQWCTVSFVNTGVQIRTTRDKSSINYKGEFFEFIPWDDILDVSVEGQDQIDRRQSVGAVLAFGVLGLAASRAIRRSYLVFATTRGDYYFEYEGLLPAGLASQLRPVLQQFSAQAPGRSEITDSGDVAALLGETNELLRAILGELRRTGDS